MSADQLASIFVFGLGCCFFIFIFYFILITNEITRQVCLWKETAFSNLQLWHSHLVFKAVSTHLAAAQLPVSVLSSKIFTADSNTECVFVLYCTAFGKALAKWVFRLVTRVPINLPAFIHIWSLLGPVPASSEAEEHLTSLKDSVTALFWGSKELRVSKKF